MSLATPEVSVEISVSSMCFGPLELPDVPTWRSDLAQMKPFLIQTKYRNYEIHPTTAIVPDVENLKAEDVEIIRTLVGSLHQTFNDKKDIYGIVASFCGVQRKWASIDGMRKIQQVLSRPVPSVHYVDLRSFKLGTDHLTYPGSFPVVQPKPEIYRDFCSDPEKLMDTLRSIGMIGLCPDTVHSRETAEDGTRSPDWRKLWANQFASGDVYQMHVSADRRDVKSHDPELAIKSRQEFLAFTSGTWEDVTNTDLYEMIDQAIKHWVPPQPLLRAVGAPVLRMVVEIPPWQKAIVHRVEDHKKFVKTLVKIINNAGAKPLRWGDATPSASAKV